MKRAVRNSGGEILVISELIDTDTQVQGKKGISVMLKVKIKFQQRLNVLKPVAESIPVDIQGLCGLLDIKGVVEILLKCFEKIRIICGIVFDQGRYDVAAQLPEILKLRYI